MTTPPTPPSAPVPQGEEIATLKRTLEAYRVRARKLYAPEFADSEVARNEARMRDVDSRLEAALGALRYFGLEMVDGPAEGVKMLMTAEKPDGTKDCAYVRVIPGGEYAKDQSELKALREMSDQFWGKYEAQTRAALPVGERIALNAALLRLFKGEYRNPGDRHSDALFVKGYTDMLPDAPANFGSGADSNIGQAGGDAQGKSSPSKEVINSPVQSAPVPQGDVKPKDTTEAQKEFERLLALADRQMQPTLDALTASTRLDGSDLTTQINATSVSTSVPQGMREAVEKAAWSVLERAYCYWEGDASGSKIAYLYWDRTARHGEAMKSLHGDFVNRITSSLAALAPHVEGAKPGTQGTLLAEAKRILEEHQDTATGQSEYLRNLIATIGRSLAATPSQPTPTDAEVKRILNEAQRLLAMVGTVHESTRLSHMSQCVQLVYDIDAALLHHTNQKAP